MKKKKEKDIWKYLTIIMLVISIFSFAYSFMPLSPAYELSDILPADYDPADAPKLNSLKVEPLSAISSVDPVDIDQKQERLDTFHQIAYIPPNAGCYRQDAMTTDKTVYAISVAVGRVSFPTKPLYIGVLYQSFDNPIDDTSWVARGVLYPDGLPDEGAIYWITLEFEDMQIIGTLPIKICCISVDDPTDGNYWVWGAAIGELQYQPSTPKSLIWDSGTWQTFPGFDFVFRTYAHMGGDPDPPPDPPVVVISTSTSIARISGFSFLSLAIVFGVKFKWF